MADRDVKVVYKSREIPEGYRPKIPTALDPYDDPDYGRPVRESKSRQERDRYSTVDDHRSTKTSNLYDRNRGSRESFGNGANYRDARSSGRFEGNDIASPRRSGDITEKTAFRSRSRNREYIVDNNVRSSDESFRRDGGAYIMDTRGDVDIIMPGRERDQIRSSRGPNQSFRDRAPRGRRTVDEDDYREGDTLPGGVVVVRRNITPPSRPRQPPTYDTRSPSHTVHRGYDRDDDWRIVESMRDTRISPGEVRDRSRPRAVTQSSEESYVLIAPTEDTRTSMRSAIQRKDYPPTELRRRRSRSISFHEDQTVSHDAGDRRHGRPGAEADISGHYLRQKAEDESEADGYEYRDSGRTSRRPREYDSDTYRRDDRYREPYPPQNDYSHRRRDRSRRRRREDDDDQSYYSEHVDKKYVKETTYR